VTTARSKVSPLESSINNVSDLDMIKRLPIHLRAKYIVEERESKLSKIREEKER